MHNIDDLCLIIDILRQELPTDVAPGEEAPASPADLLSSSIGRITADVQQRLIYRVAAFLREEVEGYVPTPADVDFPECLEAFNRRTSQRGSLPGVCVLGIGDKKPSYEVPGFVHTLFC